MNGKTYRVEGQQPPASQIGATLEALASTIAARAQAHTGESYTAQLLADNDLLASKLLEEVAEVVEAAREHAATGADADADHLRYEAGDVLYHLLVALHAHGIDLDELAAELNMRMVDSERPQGAILLHAEHVNRGK